jgi:hypothetical protein
MRRRTLLSSVLLLVTLFVSLGTASAQPFSNNRIMDDAIFDNYNSMSASQINAFLNSFPNSCISPNNGFSAIDPTGYNPSNGFLYGGNVSAGQVVYDAAQAYSINPRVLLSTLQKEQSLVQGDAGCPTTRYAKAAGYGCPDGGSSYSYSGVNLYTKNGVTFTSVSGVCVNTAAKAGFSQQVIHAAWVLKYSEQRSKGNVGWAVIRGSWDNSDDLSATYSGYMTEGCFKRSKFESTCTNYDGFATIDNTAVHMDGGATAALYRYTPHFSGNQHFVSIYSGWFGDTILPYAFKSPSNSTIYMNIDGYKIAANSMAILQDYGISPGSIQTLSQSTVDSIPVPDQASGISSSISYIVKSPSDSDGDGGSIYLISVGKRYQIQSMQQFADFGFNTSNISYLPLSYILSFKDGGTLSNFITSPYGSVFKVSGGQKRIIFTYQKYITLNPSDAVSLLSYFGADLIPSGTPLSDDPVLVQYSTGDAVYLLNNGSYFNIPTFDIYRCWGFNDSNAVLHVRIPQDNYIAPIATNTDLSCMVQDTTSSITYLLNQTSKFTVPSAFGSYPAFGADSSFNSLLNLFSNSGNLSRFVKSANSAAVWYLDSGARRVVPTYNDFVYLNATDQLTNLNGNPLGSITSNGVKLGTGSLVKATDNGAVYVVNGDTRIVYTSDEFNAYRNDWGSIQSYPVAVLDQFYPSSGAGVSKYYFDNSRNKTYLADIHGCFVLDQNELASYGQSQSVIASSQVYTGALFRGFNVNQCVSGSTFVKATDRALVYWVDNGQKHPVDTWAKLVQKSGTSNPYVITLEDSTLATLPTGSAL